MRPHFAVVLLAASLVDTMDKAERLRQTSSPPVGRVATTLFKGMYEELSPLMKKEGRIGWLWMRPYIKSLIQETVDNLVVRVFSRRKPSKRRWATSISSIYGRTICGSLNRTIFAGYNNW
nr:ATR2 protein [Hyaloperonospora arabidopsidis]